LACGLVGAAGTVRLMTSISGPAYGTYLDFASPLSQPRADRIVRYLAATRPATVLDIGCGWGELLLQILAASPEASGVGVDTDQPDVERGRSNALERGLADRVTFIEGPGADHSTPADVVMCIGASHAYGDIPTALRALKPLVNPGGRLLFAEGFWEHPPSDAELGRLWPDASAAEYSDLAGLVAQTVDAGYQPLWIESVSRDEWDQFESGHLADQAHWLLEHGDTEDAPKVRQRYEAHRTRWLTGTRELLGFAYLTLGIPAER